MKIYYLFLFILLANSCANNENPITSNDLYLVTDIKILDNRVSNITVVAKNEPFFTIEFDLVNYTGYEYNNTYLMFYDLPESKFKFLPSSEFDNDLQNGHNKFVMKTDTPGFDFYNQTYKLKNETRLNFNPMIYTELFEFIIKRK